MKFVFILLFSISAQAIAEIIPVEWQNATHKTVDIKRASYPMVRLKRLDATPVILLHGLGGNAHNWMEIGSSLYKAGYDVWAFTWSANMRRNIDQSGKLTVRELVDYVYSKTNKKVLIAGHSLGGVISKIYSLGVDRNIFTGKVIVRDYLKAHSKKHLLGLVSISSPSGFDKKLERYIPILQRMPNESRISHADLSEKVNSKSLERDLYFVKAFELSTIGSRLPIVRNYTKVMFNPIYHAFGNYDLGKLIRYGTSPISKLITNQIGSDPDQIEEAQAMNRIFHFEKNHVPFAYISGEDDDIADDLIIAREASSQKSPYLMLPAAGHMDPLSGDLVPETVYFMIKFFRSLEAKK